MNLLWITMLVLTVATLVLVLVPLLRRNSAPAPARADFDMAVYRDQLAEVDRDVERGILGPEQAEAARLEVKRRMLAAAEKPSSVPPGPQPGSVRSKRSVFSFIIVCLFVPAAALGLYLVLGMPQTPDQPFASRRQPVATTQSPAAGTDPESMSMEEAVARLADRLKADPGDLRGWLLLGRSYLTMERYPLAVEAYGNAFRLGNGRGDIASAYGEAMVAAAGGEVTVDAKSAFDRAFAQDPRDPRARYYLALHSAQQGDTKSALQGWVDLVAVSPADSPWLRVVRQQIGQAAAQLGVDAASIIPSPDAKALGEAAAMPAPSQADMDAAAKMSDQQREAMVRSMVERLASRLEEEPDDLAGWQRLARAYEVLGEAEKAKDARARIEVLQNR